MKEKGGFHPVDALCTAFSLYSRIPVPKSRVNTEGYRYALCFFPLIGAVIGIVLVFFSEIARAVTLGRVAFSCIGTAIPLIITGGIHMDGYLDTMDALSSFAPPEKMREILKDPHAGAFAFIWGGIYLLLYVAAFSELRDRAFPAVAGIFVMSRALSAWSVVAFKKAEGPGMLRSLSEGSDVFAVKVLSVGWMAASVLFFIFTAGWYTALALTAAAFICLVLCYGLSKRKFGGMNGDLAGFFLQVCELLLIIILMVFH